MADFYDPISDIATGWASTGAAHYTEIDEGIRNPSQPTLTDYLSTNSNNATDEWGFPAVTGSPPKIVAWLYAETQSKSTIVVSFQQDGVERATITIPINSPKKWYQCAWGAPSGDLSTLTIEVKQVKQGTGAGTYAYIYAAYLRAGPNLDKQVAAGADDGRRYTGSLGFSATDTYIYLGYNTGLGNLHCHGFARWIEASFEGTIDVSYIDCYVWFAGSGTPELKVYGVDEDNPAAPTSAAEFDADPLTDAAVDWDGAWTAATWERSPSLNAIFQELVDTYTISNEAVMVQIKNDHGVTGDEYNYARTWEHDDNTYGPKLHIEYTAGGAEVTKTHTLDAILKGITTTTHTLDALIQATETLNHTLDAILQSTLTKTHTLDAILKATEQVTHDLDAILQKTETESHTLDAILKATITKTYTLDAILEAAGVVTKTHTLDAILQAAITKTHTLDALLQATITKTHTLDAILQATVAKDHTLDAVLKATTTKAHTLDALLQQTLTKTHALDAILQSTFTKTYTLDAILKETITKTYTLDAILGVTGVVTKTYTLDAFLVSAFSEGPYVKASLLSEPAMMGIQGMIPEASAELEKKPEVKRTKVL